MKVNPAAGKGFCNQKEGGKGSRALSFNDVSEN